MKASEIQDSLFRSAVEAIDVGDELMLKDLIQRNPRLVTERLITSAEGYFKDPYLLWFVAGNPIRIPALPANIVVVTNLIISFIKTYSDTNSAQQFDYALELVATGKIPKDSGVQIAMMEALLKAGAIPGGALGSLAQGNPEAAAFLVERGATLTLATAIGLDRIEDAERLIMDASAGEKTTALTVAAFYGNIPMILFLLEHRANPNSFPDRGSGFHSHATPLHQAVSSGSLDAVKILVNAGARDDISDKIHAGTPRGWAFHMLSGGDVNESSKDERSRIAEFLS